MHVVSGGLGNFVTRIIVCFNRRFHGDIAVNLALVITECRRIDRDVVAQFITTQRDNIAEVMLAVNLQINHIIQARVTTHGTVDKLLWRSQFVVIQRVVFGD